MKSKGKIIGFVAVGQAGGNIGRIFEDKGYSVVYLNTSKEDLDTLDGAKFSYHIRNGDGCAKNRNRAKELLFDDYESISSEIYSHISEPVICVLFSMGGGTGSGTSPALVDMIQDDIDNGICGSSCVMQVGIIPSIRERTRATINAHQCAKEILDVKSCGATILLDNSAAENDVEEINERFVFCLDGFLEAAGSISRKGNIDREELIRTFSVNGNMMILTAPKDGAVGELIKSAGSLYPSLDGLRGIRYITISSANEIDTEQLQKEFGLPEEEFHGYNDKATFCCLSGLPFPMTRFEQMKAKTLSEKEEILQNRKQIADASLDDDLDFLSENREVASREPVKKQKSRREIMQKYMRS